MSLLKCVGMGPFDDPGSVTDPNDRTYPGTPYSDLRYPGVEGFFTDTRTGWVRFFLEYDYWFPAFGYPNPDPSQVQANAVALFNQTAATDFNIIRARQLGLRVILCLRHFSKLANNSDDAKVFPSDQNLMPVSPYSNFVYAVMSRYHPVNRFIPPVPGAPHGSIDDLHFRWVDFFEVVNEPNHELHVDPTDPDQSAAHKTALMFSTSYGIANFLNAHYRGPDPAHPLPLTGKRPLRLLGPATAAVGNFSAFTRSLLTDLKAEAEAKPKRFNLTSNIFGWSHHNYIDVKHGMPTRGNSAQQVRSVLNGTWGGYPSPSVNDPRIYLTEGGYSRSGAPTSAAQDRVQKIRMARAISRLKNNTGPGQPGDGIEMFTNFLFYTATQFDSGLCRPAPTPPPPTIDPASFERPAYDVWKTPFQ